MGLIVSDIVDLAEVPSPNVDTYVLGFDVDGILKKKDSDGIITNIEGSTSSGVSQAYVDNAISTALLIDNNLSDLANAGDARTNLDVYSTTEVDNAILASTHFFRPNIINISSVYTISATDSTVNCTSGSFTTTLPTAVGVGGRIYIIKNSGTGTITLSTTSSQTIDGSLTQQLIQYQSLTVQSDGTNWIEL